MLTFELKLKWTGMSIDHKQVYPGNPSTGHFVLWTSGWMRSQAKAGDFVPCKFPILHINSFIPTIMQTLASFPIKEQSSFL